jgi:replication-associated recombination protein RarA
VAQLHEEYRPRTWGDVAGQPAAVASIRAVLGRGWGGRAWWITGASGTGKTTLAKLIAAEGASGLATDELDAGSITPARLRELERSYANRPLPVDGKAGWCLIVNECHRLRRDTTTALLDVLERLPGHVCWVFTTTRQGQAAFFEDDATGDCAPLVSRCVEVALEDSRASRQALARRAKAVAQAAGCDGLPDAVYEWVVDACKGNLRAVLQRVECGRLAREAKAAIYAELQRPIAEQCPRRRAELQAQLAALGTV